MNNDEVDVEENQDDHDDGNQNDENQNEIDYTWMYNNDPWLPSPEYPYYQEAQEVEYFEYEPSDDIIILN